MANQEIWTTMKILTWTKEYLNSKGIVNARLESEWLLCEVLKTDRVGLYLQHDKPLNENELAAYRDFVARRARREPLQHILGSQEFCGLDFEVSGDVLIPRYDTEILVHEVLVRASNVSKILDVGTGSGCVAIALKTKLNNASVSAVDISQKALDIALRNAENNKVPIEFLCGSLLKPVEGRKFDFIVSNPPYIPTDVILTLESEVRDYDPVLALDGGKDGLDIYRLLIPSAAMCLENNGWLIVEIGINQAGDVVALFNQANRYFEPVVVQDNNGIKRVICAQLKGDL